MSSLKAFKYALLSRRGAPNSDRLFLDVYFLLYDALSDDDEEIRDIAASVVSWILSENVQAGEKHVSLHPLAASRPFASFLTSAYSDFQPFIREVLRRLTGQASEEWRGITTPLSLTPVHKMLLDARKESTDLFAEEKQNLFIDEVREVNTWSKALDSIPSRAVDTAVTQELQEWVANGITMLIDTAEAEGLDGPLGWTSTPEVFTLGLRVIEGAKVSLCWAAIESASVDNDGIIDGISRLAEIGSRPDVWLHDQWLHRINDILAVHNVYMQPSGLREMDVKGDASQCEDGSNRVQPIPPNITRNQGWSGPVSALLH